MTSRQIITKIKCLLSLVAFFDGISMPYFCFCKKMCHHRQYQEKIKKKKITNLMIIVIVYVIIYQCKFAVFCPSQMHLS